MGIDVNAVKFLLHARNTGARFDRVATIGRQSLLLTRYALAATLRSFGVPVAGDIISTWFRSDPPYAEPLLELLGATMLHAIDYSPYEGAQILHDMNTDVPEHLVGQYSLVLDGGSLEHVFNFPTAVRNCMTMTQLGGHFLAITPCNNYCGHGLYQFSPELYFRLFSPENGFERPRMYIVEDTQTAAWFEVIDPAVLTRRAVLINQRPTNLYVMARRIGSVPIALSLQQSDYSSVWGDGAKGGNRSHAAKVFGTATWLQRETTTVRRIKELIKVFGYPVMSVLGAWRDPVAYRRTNLSFGPQAIPPPIDHEDHRSA
jgi:hypothetical protein